VDEALRAAVALFNDAHFSEFQDAIDAVAGSTKARSERQFYTLLNQTAEALLQLSDGDLADAAAMASECLRKLEEFLPRFRGINTDALREDLQRLLTDVRESKEGKRKEWAPSRLPRIRVMPE
jgi:hypothetical protein